MNNIKLKEEEKFEEFYKENFTYIHYIANKILKDTEEATMIANDVVITFFNKINLFDQDKPIRPWLHKITTNKCLNKIKSDKSKKLELIVDDEEIENSDKINNEFLNIADQKNLNSLETILKKEKTKLIAKALNNLKKEFKEIIILTYYYNMSYVEVANKLNIPLGTVMSRLFNARQKAKEELIKLEIYANK